MAADISEITERNRQDIESQLAHILTDLHDVIKTLQVQGLIQARHDALLEEFRPLLNQFRSPLASAMTSRKARRNGG